MSSAFAETVSIAWKAPLHLLKTNSFSGLSINILFTGLLLCYSSLTRSDFSFVASCVLGVFKIINGIACLVSFSYRHVMSMLQAPWARIVFYYLSFTEL